MLSFNFRSLGNLLSFSDRKAVDIPSVEIHKIDTAQEKPARSLKHLLKLNHANYAILTNHLKWYNHMPHLLGSGYLLGADSDDLTRIYEDETKMLVPWEDAPGEISTYDWRDYLSKREYQRAFVDFFEDELVRHGYDWKEVIGEYLYSGKNPLFSSLCNDIGHPVIHLAYAFEFDSRELAMEALSMAATGYGNFHKYFDEPAYSQPNSTYSTTSLYEILENVRTDPQFDGLFTQPAGNNIDVLFREREADILRHWNAWKMDDPLQQFRATQEVSVALLAATTCDSSPNFDFYLLHVLTTSHAIRVLLPLIPGRFQIPLIQQWWLMTLSCYVSQLRPKIDLDSVRNYQLDGRDWGWTAKQAVKGKESGDPHYVKAVRAFKVFADTWGDADSFYLKAAVKFVAEFKEWGNAL